MHLNFIARRPQPFLPSSSCVELRLPTLHRRSQQLILFIFANKVISHEGGIRTPGPALAELLIDHRGDRLNCITVYTHEYINTCVGYGCLMKHVRPNKVYKAGNRLLLRPSRIVVSYHVSYAYAYNKHTWTTQTIQEGPLQLIHTSTLWAPTTTSSNSKHSKHVSVPALYDVPKTNTILTQQCNAYWLLAQIGPCTTTHRKTFGMMRAVLIFLSLREQRRSSDAAVRPCCKTKEPKAQNQIPGI